MIEGFDCQASRKAWMRMAWRMYMLDIVEERSEDFYSGLHIGACKEPLCVLQHFVYDNFLTVMHLIPDGKEIGVDILIWMQKRIDASVVKTT